MLGPRWPYVGGRAVSWELFKRSWSDLEAILSSILTHGTADEKQMLDFRNSEGGIRGIRRWHSGHL